MRSRVMWIAVVVGAVVQAGCEDAVLDAFSGEPQTGVIQLVGWSGASIVSENATLRWSVTPDATVLVPRRVLSVPDTVAAGTTFTATVATLGLSGCWSAAGQDVRVGEAVVELTPLDVHSGAGVCTEIVQELMHETALALTRRGEWTVRVRGRRVVRGEDTWHESVVAEKTVVVR